MTTVSELLAARAAAGARYAAATAELSAAYIDLGGTDLALNSARTLTSVSTFRGDADRIPVEFRHPEFAPDAGKSLVDAMKARRDAVMASLPAA